MVFSILGFEDLVPLLVFGGIVAGIWAILSMISNRNSQALDRLSRLSRPTSLAEIEDPLKQGKGNKFQGLTDAVKSISKPLMPQGEVEQNALKTKLANAGFRSDAAPMVYSGIRLVCLAVCFLISVAIFVPGRPFGWKMLQGVVIMTGCGFTLPSDPVVPPLEAATRFPDLAGRLDLLVVCVESGLGLMRAEKSHRRAGKPREGYFRRVFAGELPVADGPPASRSAP